MYQEEFKRWLAADLEDPDLKPELSRIEGNDDEIKERFAVALKFGTAGLRGVLGAGTFVKKPTILQNREIPGRLKDR